MMVNFDYLTYGEAVRCALVDQHTGHIHKQDPEVEFEAATMTTGDELNLSTLFTSSLDQEVVFSVVDPGTTGAEIAEGILQAEPGECVIGAHQDGNILFNPVDVTTTITVAKADPTITFSDGSVVTEGTLDLTTLLVTNSDGEVTFSTESSAVSITDNVLTAGDTEGEVTVSVSQAATDIFNAASASATITISAPVVEDNENEAQ